MAAGLVAAGLVAAGLVASPAVAWAAGSAPAGHPPVGHAQASTGPASGAGTTTIGLADTPTPLYTAFVLDSDDDYVGLNQQLEFDATNSTITASVSPTDPSVVVMEVTAPGHQFSAALGPPASQTLAVGTYSDATVDGIPLAGMAPINISGDGRGCNNVTATFTVVEITYDAQGNLTSFAADAVYHCEGEAATLYASLRWNSIVPYSALSFQPSIARQPLPFATEPVGAPSPPVALAVSNTGVLPLSLSPSVAGVFSPDYQITASTCPSTPVTGAMLGPGASCSMTIVFTPHGLGDRSSSLDLLDSTPAGEHVIPLAGTGTALPNFTSPQPGQANVDTSQPFTWTVGPGTQGTRLIVGSTPGAHDLVDSGVLRATTTSYAVPALPAGTTLYATVLAETNGAWTLSQPITFTAEAQVAALTNPTTGSLVDPRLPFTWTTNSQASGYWLVVGTSPGSANLLNTGPLPATQATYPVAPMPDGPILYATLFTNWAGSWNHWQSISFAYQNNGSTFLFPLNGQQAVSVTAPIIWTALPNVQGYYLVVGTKPGKADVVNSGLLPADQNWYWPAHLPAGTTLYAYIFTDIGGTLPYYQNITFRTAAAASAGQATT